MKKTLFYVLMFSFHLSVFAQAASKNTAAVVVYDTLKYDYAILLVKESDDEPIVRYSNGKGENISEQITLFKHTDRKEWLQNIFLCFKYLNQKGFELISESTYYTIIDNLFVKEREFQKEYIFKRNTIVR